MSLTITLPLTSIDSDVIVDWGDGDIETFNTPGNKTHTYAVHDQYEVRISGGLKSYGAVINQPELIACTTFGDLEIENLSNAFRNATNLTTVPNNLPSTVTNISNIFNGCTNFNQNINNWDVSNCSNLTSVFQNCSAFNQPLNNWNVSNCLNFTTMFAGCASFNQNINNWNVSNALFFDRMFAGCVSFNQNINNWNVSTASDFYGMFQNCSSFNQPLDNWNVSNSVGFEIMFQNCSSFNQSLNNWNVSSGLWFMSMFQNCSSFNQPLDNWNVSNAIDFSSMFQNCTAFDQSLETWQLNEFGVNMTNMLSSTNLSVTNYSRTLIGWANTVSINLGPYNTILGADSIEYDNFPHGGVPFDNAVSARSFLVDTLPTGAEWVINGDVLIKDEFPDWDGADAGDWSLFPLAFDSLSLNTVTNEVSFVSKTPESTDVNAHISTNLAPNGHIYSFPWGAGANRVFKFNTNTEQFTNISSTFALLGYYNGVLAENGSIYGVPFDATTIRRIDTSTDTVSTFGFISGTNKYAGGVLADNGVIYCPNYSSNNILRINTNTNTISTFASPITGAGRFVGACRGANGLIYGIPSSANSILRIDPSTDSASSLSSGLIPATSAKWEGGVLAKNGIIYCIPNNTNAGILKIDTNFPSGSEVVTMLTEPLIFSDSPAGKYSNACISSDGTIYAMPIRVPYILRIDPETDTVTKFGPDALNPTHSFEYIISCHLDGDVSATPDVGLTIGEVLLGSVTGGEAILVSVDNIFYDNMFDQTYFDITVKNINYIAHRHQFGNSGFEFVTGQSSGVILEFNNNDTRFKIYSQPTLHPNGFIYSIGRSEEDIIKIDTNNPVDINLPLSRFYNKY